MGVLPIARRLSGKALVTTTVVFWAELTGVTLGPAQLDKTRLVFTRHWLVRLAHCRTRGTVFVHLKQEIAICNRLVK